MDTDYGICQIAIAPVRSQATDESEIVTQLLFGDYVKITEQGNPWVKIYFPADDYEGWMDCKQLHTITAEEYEQAYKVEHETVKTGNLKVRGPIGDHFIIFGSNLPFLSGKEFKLGSFVGTVIDELPPFNESLTETALRFLYTPYLWGGKGIFGIDCSGFTQIVAKVHGIYLPRDASQQCQVGQSIDFDKRQIGDLMYFVKDNGTVHHVGFIVNDTEVIHAAGYVRLDTYDEQGIYRTGEDGYTHKFYSIKRIWIK